MSTSNEKKAPQNRTYTGGTGRNRGRDRRRNRISLEQPQAKYLRLFAFQDYFSFIFCLAQKGGWHISSIPPAEESPGYCGA